MSNVKVRKFISKMLGANTYVVYSEKAFFIIDPCVKPELIDEFLKPLKLKPTFILITHSHIDHILFINETRDFYNMPVLVHEDDFSELTDNAKNGSALFGYNKYFRDADRKIGDNETITAGDMTIKTIATPGHTPGSVSYYIDNMVFTGDTLFYLSIGRTDLGRGDQEEIMDSINNKLFNLPGKTLVYPGHGIFTSIEYEKNENPFVIG